MVGDGHIIWFERGDPPRIERLRAGKPFDLVIAQSGELRSTAGPVGRLRQRYAARPELYGKFFRLAGDLVRAGRSALEDGDWETLGALMDAGQGLLNGFGVSTPTLERMIGIARGAGALGAKLSGAGGGGVIIALAPERSSEVVEALGACGFEAFVTRVGAPVVEGRRCRVESQKRVSSTTSATASRISPAGVGRAIERAQHRFLSLQSDEGYWHAPLEANVTMNAQYVFFNRFLGRSRPEVEKRLRRTHACDPARRRQLGALRERSRPSERDDRGVCRAAHAGRRRG